MALGEKQLRAASDILLIELIRSKHGAIHLLKKNVFERVLVNVLMTFRCHPC